MKKPFTKPQKNTECGVYRIYVHKKSNIMKKLAIIPLAAITFLCSCSKSNNVNPTKTTTIPTTPSSLVADSVSLYAGSPTNLVFANGPVLSATFVYPEGLAIDASGNVYVADTGNNLIRKITPAGIVSTYAGNGTAGYADGAAATAEFNLPANVAVDGAGNVYVTESVNPYIRKITPQGQVSTIANGIYFGMAFDAAGNLYVTGYYNITEITANGVQKVIAGTGAQGAQDGPAGSATFDGLEGIAIDTEGGLYVCDQGNNLIRKISKGQVTTIAGTGKPGSTDGPALSASFFGPKSIVLDPWGNMYVADKANRKIRKITAGGQVSTFAGSNISEYNNGPALSASFPFPQSLILTPAGYFLVANGSGGPDVIQKISTTIVENN
jgi:serine/threonine protein kinase, bacterial